MKKIHKLVACALLLMLSTTAFAKKTEMNTNAWYDFSHKKFTFVDAYEARVHVMYTQSAPGIYNYSIWLDIVDQAVQSPLTVPGAFTMSISLNTIGTSVNSYSMTISAGYNASPFTTFIADHVLTFSDFRGWTQSVYSYNGVPIGPNYILH